MKENENKSQTSIGESCIGCRLFFFFFVLSFYFRSCLAPTHLRNLLGAKHGAHMLFCGQDGMARGCKVLGDD